MPPSRQVLVDDLGQPSPDKWQALSSFFIVNSFDHRIREKCRRIPVFYVSLNAVVSPLMLKKEKKISKWLHILHFEANRSLWVNQNLAIGKGKLCYVRFGHVRSSKVR